MRILITHHFPLNVSPLGRYTHDLAAALVALGHEVRCLVVDDRPRNDDVFPVRRVVCSSSSNTRSSAVDLPFALPGFSSDSSARFTFADLTDEQLAHYRDQLRRALDIEVHQFDPQLIHTQHAWVLGQLAVEAGVPFVISAWGPELVDAVDPRYEPLAQQAAENAGRILVGSTALADQIAVSFGIEASELTVVPPAVAIDRPHDIRVSREELLSRLGIEAHGGPLVLVPDAATSLDSGLETMLNAAARYEALLPNVTTFVVSGLGAPCEWLTLARRLGLQRTYCVEEPAREVFDSLLAMADLVVVPDQVARGELMALEAMAAGTPVVATDSSGAADLVRPEFGAIVAAEDHELLADVILRAVSDGWKRSKGPVAAEYSRRNHDLAQNIGSITAIYESVYQRRFGRQPE